MKIKSTLLCFFIASLVSLSFGLAQPKNSRIGEIKIESYEKKRTDLEERRKNNFEHIKKIATTMQSIANSPHHLNFVRTKIKGTKNPAIDLDLIDYLTIVYLRCSVGSGACPMVLDAILELDIINSYLNKKAECPTMKSFWSMWIANDMEKRHKHLIQIRFLRDHEYFNRNIRPQYIRCESTIQKIINTNSSNFFNTRYGNNSEVIKNYKELITMLESFEKNPRIAYQIDDKN